MYICVKVVMCIAGTCHVPSWLEFLWWPYATCWPTSPIWRSCPKKLCSGHLLWQLWVLGRLLELCTPFSTGCLDAGGRSGWGVGAPGGKILVLFIFRFIACSRQCTYMHTQTRAHTVRYITYNGMHHSDVFPNQLSINYAHTCTHSCSVVEHRTCE